VTGLPIHQGRTQHEILSDYFSILLPQRKIGAKIIILKPVIIIDEQDKLSFRRLDSMVPQFTRIAAYSGVIRIAFGTES